MCHLLISVVGVLLLASLAVAAPPDDSVGVECNWGLLTMEQILEDDFDQGAHASDPSDDGRGPEERVGLANVVERGNMQALCELIESLL